MIVKSKPLLFVFIFLSTFVLLTKSAGIEVSSHDVSMLEKKKIYCSMISYHFLDYDMDTFQAFTKNFTKLKTDGFKAKVALRLAENCQKKITNQQLQELTQLVENPTGHENQIQSLEDKYIEYFTPQENIILKLLEQVDHETEQQIQKEINTYHESRQEVENAAEKVAKGFKMVTEHLKHATHHTANQINDFMASFLHLHGNVSSGWSRFQEGLSQNLQSIKGNLTEKVNELSDHPHVKIAKEWINSLWGSEDL